MSLSVGETVCFMTDGISDVLTSEPAWDKIKEDVTAICITAIDWVRLAVKQELGVVV